MHEDENKSEEVESEQPEIKSENIKIVGSQGRAIVMVGGSIINNVAKVQTEISDSGHVAVITINLDQKGFSFNL